MDFYSQIGQDRWVHEIIGDKGYFVDIGAYDGVALSNTYALERMGWTGLCVEANPQVFERLAASRTCRCCYCAVADSDGERLFCVNDMGSALDAGGDVLVPTYSLTSLFAKCVVPLVIDYVSLDIEGGEVAALSGFPFDTHTVKLWTVEHNLYANGNDHKNRIASILLDRGYVLARENVDSNGYMMEDWWAHPSMMEKLHG